MEANDQLVVFGLDDRRYGLRLSSVQRIVRAVEITHLPDAPPPVLGVIDVEGCVIPVIDTRKRLGLPEREMGLQDVFIIVGSGGGSLALVADEVMPVIDIPLQRLAGSEEVKQSSGFVESVAKVEDGLIMVLTVEKTLPVENVGGRNSERLSAF